MNEKQGGVVVVVAVGVCYLWVSVWGGGVCLQGQVHQAREQVKLPLCLGSGSLAGRRVKGARDKGGTECVPRGKVRVRLNQVIKPSLPINSLGFAL